MRAKFGLVPTAVSKNLSFKFISRFFSLIYNVCIIYSNSECHCGGFYALKNKIIIIIIGNVSLYLSCMKGTTVQCKCTLK